MAVCLSFALSHTVRTQLAYIVTEIAASEVPKLKIVTEMSDHVYKKKMGMISFCVLCPLDIFTVV